VKLTKIFLFLVILLFPYVRYFKFNLIAGNDLLSFDLSFEEYLCFSKTVVDRFSYIPNMVFLDENTIYLQKLISSDYMPFFQGYFGSLLHKVVFGDAVSNINLFVYEMMTGGSAISNSTFPLLSYFSLDFGYGFFVAFYSFLLIVIFIFLMRFIGYPDKSTKKFLLFMFFITLLSGWFWNALNIIQAALFFLIFLKIYTVLYLYKKKDCYDQ
jgi:hypothetical protein